MKEKIQQRIKNATRSDFTVLGLGAIIILSMVLTGCGDNSKKAKMDRYLHSVKQSSTANIAPIPKARISDNTYTGSKQRNPFENPYIAQMKKRYPNTQLPQYALDTLKLTGILSQDKKTWAIVASPDGKKHKITVGMRVGINQVLVTKITQNEVQLLDQSYLDYGHKAKKVVLTLRK